MIKLGTDNKIICTLYFLCFTKQ